MSAIVQKTAHILNHIRPELPLRTSSFTSLSNSPNFRSRWPALQHSDTDTVASRVKEFFAENWPWKSDQARKVFIKEDQELFTLYCMPEALDNRVELAAKVIDLLFLLDDIMDAWSMEQAKSFLKIFAKLVMGTRPPSTENKVQQIVASVFGAIRETDDENDLYQLGHEFCEEFCAWFATVASDKRLGASKAEKGLQEYMDYRICDSGYWMTIALARWACDVRVPTTVRQNETFAALERAAGYHASLLNDLYSYQREVDAAKKQGSGEIAKSLVNAVALVMNERGIDEREATRSLEGFISGLEVRFEELHNALSERFSDDEKRAAEKYARTLKQVCAGNAKWSTFCGRYHRRSL